MVIFGGLEFVAAGYLFHKYNKSQKEKKKSETDARVGRPGQSCPRRPQGHCQLQPQHCRPSPQPKYHTYAYTHTHTVPGHQRPVPPHQPHHQQQQQYTGRPHPYIQQHTQSQVYLAAPYTAQTFPISQHHHPQQPQPRPQIYAHAQPSQPPPIILPPRRSDSSASRPPVVNGTPPTDLWHFEEHGPSTDTLALSAPQHHPYGHASFSASSPSLAGSTVYTPSQREEYASQSPHVRFAAQGRRTGDGEPEGEDDPPPPYRP